jgi:hypothetical protein
MKNFLVLFLCVSMCIGALAGCGAGAETAEPARTAAAEEAPAETAPPEPSEEPTPTPEPTLEPTPEPTPEPPVEGLKEKVGNYTFLMPLEAIRETDDSGGLYYVDVDDDLGSISWSMDAVGAVGAENAASAVSDVLERLSKSESFENYDSGMGDAIAGNPAGEFSYEATTDDGAVRYHKGYVFFDEQGRYFFEMNAPEGGTDALEEQFNMVVDSIRLEPDAVDGDTALSSSPLEDSSPGTFNRRFFNELIMVNTMLGEENGIIIPIARMGVDQDEDNTQVYKHTFGVVASHMYYYTDPDGEVVAGFTETSTEYGVGFGGKKEAVAMSLAFAPLGEGETISDRIAVIDEIPMGSTGMHSVGSVLDDTMTMITPTRWGDYNTYFFQRIGLDEEVSEAAMDWCAAMWKSLSEE